MNAIKIVNFYNQRSLLHLEKVFSLLYGSFVVKFNVRSCGRCRISLNNIWCEHSKNL